MIQMDHPSMDHLDRLRQNLDLLGVKFIGCFQTIEEFGAAVDLKFPVHAISSSRFLHIFISWLYDRLTDIDLSDEGAAREEIRTWHTYLRECCVGDHLFADAFKDWEAEQVKIDPSSSRRLGFARNEIYKMLDFEQSESRLIRIPRKEPSVEIPPSSSAVPLSPHDVNEAGPSFEADDGGNGASYFDTVGRPRSPNNEPATGPGEPHAGDNHSGAIHPDRLMQSQQETNDPYEPCDPYDPNEPYDPYDPSGGEDLMHNDPSDNDRRSYPETTSGVAYMDSAELTLRHRSDPQMTTVVHHGPGPFSTPQGRTGESFASPSDANCPARMNAQQPTSQQKSKLPRAQNRHRKNKRPYACKRCNCPGHRMEDCPTNLNPRYDVTPLEGYVCTWCDIPGHYSTVCPKNKGWNSVNQQRLRAGIIQPKTPSSAFRPPPQRESRERVRPRRTEYYGRLSPPTIDEPRRDSQRARSIDRYQSYRSRSRSPMGDRYPSRWAPAIGRDQYGRSRSPGNTGNRSRYDYRERPREREADLRLTPPPFSSRFRQPFCNTNAEDRSQEGKPRELETNHISSYCQDRKTEVMTVEKFSNILRPRVYKPPVSEQPVNKQHISKQPASEQPVSEKSASKTNAEGHTQKDKPIEQKANSKTTAPDIESILRQCDISTNGRRPWNSKRAPPSFPGSLDFAIYDEVAEFDAALNELIADVRNAVWQDEGRMLSVKSLDRDYHPKVLELFRDRPNVRVHTIQRNRARDWFASTFEADLDSRVNEFQVSTPEHYPEEPPIRVVVDPIELADLDITPVADIHPDRDYGIQVDLEAAEEANEVSNDSFTEKRDSVMEDVGSLQLDKIE